MNTPAISNPLNVATGSPSAAKTSDTPVDTPFGQVLSREMAARPASSEPARATAGKRNEATQVARAEKGSSKAESTQDSADTNAAEGESATLDGATAKAGTDAANAADADTDAPVSAASEELLALVASLTQPMPARTDDAATAAAGLETPATAMPADTATTTDAAVLLTPAGTQAATLTPAPADAEGRAQAPGQDIAALAGSIRPNGRAKADAAGDRSIAADARQANAGLAPTGNDKAAAQAGPAEAAAPGAEFAAQLSPRDAAAAKTSADAAAPFNLAGTAPAQQMQQAQAAPAAAMAERLAPRVGTPGWDQALGQKVIWMVGGELQSASLTLNPPELGPLQVVLNVANSQATADFTAAQPEVRQALEAAMPKLRQMLGEAGIELSQTSVSAGMPGNPQHAFERPQQGQGGQHAASRSDDADKPAPIVRSQTITGGQGLVDTFA